MYTLYRAYIIHVERIHIECVVCMRNIYNYTYIWRGLMFCMSQVIYSYGKTGNETLIWVKLGPCNLAFLLDANWWENMLDRSCSPGPSSEGISRVLSLQIPIDYPRNNSPTEHICYKQKHMGVSWNGGTPKMLDRLERKIHLQMDENWGYPHFRKPPYSTSIHLWIPMIAMSASYLGNDVCRKRAGQALVMTGTNALQAVLVLKQDTLSR